MNTNDLSTTITAGGTAQSIGALVGRHSLVIVNPDPSEYLWVAFGRTAQVNGAGSVPVAPLGSLSFNGDAPGGSISILAATTGHKVTAWES